MNGQLAALLVILAGMVMVGFVVTLPSRVLQPIVRDKLLRLLDDIDWSVRDEELPRDDPAVRFLRDCVYTAAVVQRPSAVELLYVMRHRDEVDALRDEALPTPVNLTPEQRSTYHDFERRLRYLIPAYVLFGSWIGLLSVALHASLAHRIGREVRRRRRGLGPNPHDCGSEPLVPDRIVVSAVDVIGDGRRAMTPAA